jgi:hypothetical protein
MSSQVIDKLSLGAVVLPDVNINQPSKYVFLKGLSGGRQYLQLTANSVSSTNVSFNYSPSSNVIIGRKMWIKYSLLCTLTGTSTSGNPLINIGLSDAVRACPLQLNCSSVELQLNGTQISIANMNELLPAIMSYMSREERYQDFSSGFSMLDTMQSYNDPAVYGYARSPLANFGENSFEVPRGVSVAYTVASNTTTSASVLVTICEPLFLSPLCWGKLQKKGLALLQTINLQMTFSLSRMWSHASTLQGTQITGQSFTIASSGGASFDPILMLEVLSPDLSVPQCVPLYDSHYNYTYNQIVFNKYDQNSSVATGASFSTAINSIQYSVVPKCILIYAKQTLGTQQQLITPNWSATNSCDVFHRINSISVSINGKSNLLSEASPEQLYQIAVKNGYQGSWQQWNYFSGGVLCLQMGSDIPLETGQASGSVTNFNFQVSNINITNLSAITQYISICVVAVYDSVVSISRNTLDTTAGVLNAEQVITLPVVDAEVPNGRYGSGFFGDLFSGLKTGLSKAWDIGSKLLPVGKQALALLPEVQKALGRGKAKGRKGKGMYGGQIRTIENTKVLDSHELRKRLTDYDQDEYSESD